MPSTARKILQFSCGTVSVIICVVYYAACLYVEMHPIEFDAARAGPVCMEMFIDGIDWGIHRTTLTSSEQLSIVEFFHFNIILSITASTPSAIRAIMSKDRGDLFFVPLFFCISLTLFIVFMLYEFHEMYIKKCVSLPILGAPSKYAIQIWCLGILTLLVSLVLIPKEANYGHD